MLPLSLIIRQIRNPINSNGIDMIENNNNNHNDTNGSNNKSANHP